MKLNCKIRSIGNSLGIILPKAIIKGLELSKEDSFTLELIDGNIVLKGVRNENSER